jgi:hypothetical protein
VRLRDHFPWAKRAPFSQLFAIGQDLALGGRPALVSGHSLDVRRVLLLHWQTLRGRANGAFASRWTVLAAWSAANARALVLSAWRRCEPLQYPCDWAHPEDELQLATAYMKVF